jgi:regulator of replication initiation timing
MPPITIDEFNTAITEIGSFENVSEVRTRLTELQDNVTEIFNEHATLTTNNATLTKEKEDLQAANLKLFLSVSEKKKAEDTDGGSEGSEPNLKYDDLFNEKGELK